VFLLFFISILLRISDGQTCSYMWDPVFEGNPTNLPAMCPVTTTSGQSCIFPFQYSGINYTTCTINGPNNPEFRPQCATDVDSSHSVITWSFCEVPTDAVVFYSTVRKNGGWTQNSGSLQGGTMIWIYGNRFAQNGFNTVPSTTNTNTVQLVDGYSVYDCTMHTDKVTNTQLTCYTPKMPEGVYQIRVYVNGNLVPLYQYYDPKRATFLPTSSQTPSITGITPSTGTPHTLVTLSGAFKSACFSRDMDDCSQDNNPLISRIYMGGQLCNMIDPDTSANYSEVTTSKLQCSFDGNEVGIFNVSMIITNEYGRSAVRSDLYRVSPTSQLYNFQTYAVVSSISPNTGSTEGGTTLTITGQYFSHSSQYPIVIRAGGQICSLLSVTSTVIQCQTPPNPTVVSNSSQGGRGLHVYMERIIVSQAMMTSTNPTMPSSAANLSWTDDASYTSQTSTNETVWMIGFLRVPITGTFTFTVKTNGYAALFLSTNDDPTSKTKIADASTSYQSNAIVLQNETNYYLFCMGARVGGNLTLSIQTRMHQTTLSAGVSSLVLNEIQQIHINTTIINEKQSIVYPTNTAGNGTSEIQSIAVDNSTFQIGFGGVYTGLLSGQPRASIVQAALNDLPSIYPLSVKVESSNDQYVITFPVEMGNVPLLTVITTSSNPANVTEIIPGVASGSKIAFHLDGATTRYMDLINSSSTSSNVSTVFDELFSIRCPVSMNNQQATPSIVYVQDFETNCVYDETPMATRAFCGKCSLVGNTLVSSNTRGADYLCFAYRLLNSYVTEIALSIQLNGDTKTTYWPSITFTPVADKLWHYTCLNVRSILNAQSSTYSSASSMVITGAWLNRNVLQGIMIDTVTVRTSLPIGYEDRSLYPIDQASNSSACVFPFYYNGQSYTSCTLDINNLPICADASNQTYSCQSVSIEGVRRLYPKRQLVYNTLQVNHNRNTSTIDVTFRYSDCSTPTLISILPSTVIGTITRVTSASPAASGTFDLTFNGQTYPSIPVNIDPSELTNRLQGSSDFGFLKITRSRDCAAYSYTIEWLTSGGQKSALVISNTSNLLPVGTTVNAAIKQRGGAVLNPIPGDMTRTYHTVRQVEVFVGGYASRCAANTNNSCSYRWLTSQTPTITSISQTGMSLSINGTGFGTNTILIGGIDACVVTSSSLISITCTINNAPSGTYSINVNVQEKGLALKTNNFTVTIPLQINSMTPIHGGAGGGYTLTVIGTGFSSSSQVTIDNNPCTNVKVTNYSTITCVVPATASLVNRSSVVSVIDGSNVANASTVFTYDVTNTPSISSISPTMVTLNPGQLIINGSSFGTSEISVFIGSTAASLVSYSNNQIIVQLPSLEPGRYLVSVSTNNGYARPPIYLEYVFYIKQVTPQVGSLFGGTDVYIHGEGFSNSTNVTFYDETNAREILCNTVAVLQSNLIHCRTTPGVPQVTITTNGVDPTYGTGFAWSPQFATVQRGANVTWQWGSSALLTTLAYKVQQVATAYATEPLLNGFDSGFATASGSFSYQFDTLGTYYYWSTPVDEADQIVLRGMITVVDAQPQTFTVQAKFNSYMAQSCVFPFTFNSINYTACTSVNDTQRWCSPSATYTGQRLYCNTSSIPTSSCGSSSLINPTSCSQTIPTSNPLKFLSTFCTVGSVASITPSQGPAGTVFNITGTGFSTALCEQSIEIGSSYRCPIISASSTQLTCQIGNGSLLNAKSSLPIRIARDRQGYLINHGRFDFQFQASILSVSPSMGSVFGGNDVIITGDGFVPEDTRLFIAGTDYTSLATITYSRIVFKAPAEYMYVNVNISVLVLVGTTQAVCLASSPSSCTYQWSTNMASYLDSISPTSINGPTTLTLTGRNLLIGGGVIANTKIIINENRCNVTSITNTSIVCQIGSIEAGNYSISGLITDVGSMWSTISLLSIPVLQTVSPSTSGIYGGLVLTITGSGFSSNRSAVQIKVGSNICPLIQVSSSQLQCTVPERGSQSSSVNITVITNGITLPSSTLFNYNSVNTPTVSSVSPTQGGVGQVLTITGTNFISNETNVFIGDNLCTITSISTTSITCTVASGSAGLQTVLVRVNSYGYSNRNIQFTYNLQLASVTPTQGSYGGGQLVTINGDGFNATNITVTLCSRPCTTLSVLSNTQLTCVTPAAPIVLTDTSCNFAVSVGSITQTIGFVYRTNLTATLTSVSPARGGTGGQTLLTINGTNFPNSINSVSVTIAGVSCTVQTISSTSLTCKTGSYSQTTIQAPIILSINGAGNAVGSVNFQYINLWSSRWTWGGNDPPEEGTIVVIDNGKTVYFDTTTPILKAIVIDNGSLIFDDTQDVALNVEYIVIVNGGRFQVGTESNPYQHRAVITMYGHLRSIELPIFGAKVLALRDGTVDMHGKPMNLMWTHLATTAYNGSSTITLLQPVNWPVGSQIIIPSTGDYLSQKENEKRTITAISSNGTVLTLNAPLTWTHLGVTKQFGSTTIQLRAEVGLLSHNIVFQGSVTETWNQTIEACPQGFNPDEHAIQTCFLGRYGEEIGSDQFGASIMASGDMEATSGDLQPVVLRLSNIEVFNGGQAFRLGRYPVHFHMNGNMSKSYIKSSSIHQTYNRAVNIHASHYVTVENNVIYNIMGGAMFLEDGVEIGNVLRGNLAVFVRTSSSLLNDDVTPAAFWVTNPNNTVEHNAVAGGTHFGYWYRMLRTPDGPSFAMYPDFCPHRQPFGRFYNNSVHSCGQFGVWIFPEYQPTTGGNCWADAPRQAVFERLITWRNTKGFEAVMSNVIQVRDSIAYDNIDMGIAYLTAIDHREINLPNLRETFYNINTGASIINCVIIGDTGLGKGPVAPWRGGLIVVWDRGLRVRNVSFYNFQSASTQAIHGPVKSGRAADYEGGWITKFSQITFTNVTNRAMFRWPYDGIYLDEDGSLSGSPNATLLATDGLLNTSSACTPASNYYNGLLCSASLNNWIRFSFNGANLDQNAEVLFIYDMFNRSTFSPWRKKRLTHPEGYMIVFQSKQTYTLEFQNAPSSVNISYNGVFYNLAAGDFVIVRHKIEYMPDRVYTISRSTLARQSPTPLSGVSSNNGDWYYDNITTYFSYIVKNPSNNATPIDVAVPLNAYKCRYPNCEYPIQPGLELPATARPSTALFWSNHSHWSFTTDGTVNATRPANNTDVYIPRGIWMVVDYPLPHIKALRIDGVLEFEQGINNTLYANSIFINGGQLIVGWPNNPLTSNVDIVITGDKTTNVLLPNDAGSMGQKVIGVFGGLDLHGIRRNITWTRLASTAYVGQNFLNLSQAVDWRVGDEIIVTTTDLNMEHTERHTIASISNGNKQLTTVNPLAYSHLFIEQTFPNGKSVRIAAAVGLLTHNVRVINPTSSSPTDLFGFRVLVTDYAINILNPVVNETILTYYKGYARISNTQFMGFGQFFNANDEDKREAIHLFNLGNWNASRPTYVDSCSFDQGFYSAVGTWSTNGVPITNNVVYHTYESAIVVTGQNNIVKNNLVATVYWSGTAEPEYAEFNMNYDGAIMSRDAISVIMTDNLVVGVERLAYRIQGDACSTTNIPSNISNDYSNNEAHSAMGGVNIWPMDKGFEYDLECILLKGFTMYKMFYYGMYINTPRNITIDSCTIVDSMVGIFSFVVGPSALTHIASNNVVKVRNSLVIGSITPNDCGDVLNQSSPNIVLTEKAVPTVISPNATGEPQGRCGIVFAYISPNNKMPVKPWTGIKAYPSVVGGMIISNTTLAYFNDVCNRHDTAIQVGQHNDDGQFPVTTNSMWKYNVSRSNVIFNGRPNIEVVNSADCVDMDCDALKKALLIDQDGTLFDSAGSAISQAEYLWGNQQHGIGDYRIPTVALANGTGHQININLTYPYRGITRGSACSYQSAWQMYFCNNTFDYHMLMIESMDRDTETRRLSPVGIFSDTGFIDLINGPQDHGCCNGYTCRKRVSTFMALVQAQHTFLIYLTSTQPDHMRFRLLHGSNQSKVILALQYNSLQQVDVYANDVYVSPTNRDTSFPFLMLLDQPNNVTLTSSPGANFFDRTHQLAYFLIDGNTVIDLKIAPLLVLTFGLPPVTPSSFFTNNLVANLAALLGVSSNMIRRVNIIAENNTNTRPRRQVGVIQMIIELREDPVNNLSLNSSISNGSLTMVTASILDRFQSGQLQEAFANDPATNHTSPTSLSVQEPMSQVTTSLGVVSRIALVTPPNSCREQSPCTTQPVIVAYDDNGNVIQKLGSNDYPWQLIATIVGQPNATVPGGVANYSDGQSQYSFFGFPNIGSFQMKFSLVPPIGINSSFLSTLNLTVISGTISVTATTIAGLEMNHVYVTHVNERFDVSVMPVDSITRRRLGKVMWGGWNWTASVSFYTLPQYSRSGTLIVDSSSRTLIDMDAGTVTITNVAIDSVGMFMLNVSLVSSNQQYAFQVRTNGILVLGNGKTLEVEDGDPVTNMTFEGDYDALEANADLELKRVMIYNYLLSVEMPITSDITMWKRDYIVAAFLTGTSADKIANAVNVTRSNPDIIPGLKAVGINIISRVYNITSSPRSSGSSSSSGPNSNSGSPTSTTETKSSPPNVGLIVGLTVGLVGGLALVVGAFFALKAYDNKLGKASINAGYQMADLQERQPVVQTGPEVIETPKPRPISQSKRVHRLPPIAVPPQPTLQPPQVNPDHSHNPSGAMMHTPLEVTHMPEPLDETHAMPEVQLISFQ